MMDTPTVYQSLISDRSRRLRTVGLCLLAVIVAMTVYGYFSLMPSLRVAAHKNTPATISRTAVRNSAKNSDIVTDMSRQEREAQAAKLVFAYAYWGVCLSLLVALMLVAWLDFREVGRNFDQQQAAMFAASLKNETTQTE